MRHPTDQEATISAGAWLERPLVVPSAREPALKRGITDRGLNPFTFAFLRIAHGAGVGDGSDIVRDLPSRAARRC